MKKFGMMKKSRRAEMGVGTMIIFIAMILVAAVAASVLISTANDVREQAEATGDEAINNIASCLIVEQVTGGVDTGAVTSVNLYIRLASGSPAIDLNDVVITFNDGAAIYEHTYELGFNATWIHEAGGDSANDIIGTGDLINLEIDTDVSLDTSQHVIITIIPEIGSPATEEFTTPSTYLTDVVDLA